MSPLLTFPEGEGSWVRSLFLGAMGLLYETVLINSMINSTALTNNPKYLKECIDGVFNYQYVTAAMVGEYQALCDKVKRDAVKFNYPLFIVCGGENLIQSLQDIRKFYREISSVEKVSMVYGRGYHQLYKEELAEEEIFSKVINWMRDSNSNKN